MKAPKPFQTVKKIIHVHVPTQLVVSTPHPYFTSLQPLACVLLPSSLATLLTSSEVEYTLFWPPARTTDSCTWARSFTLSIGVWNTFAISCAATPLTAPWTAGLCPAVAILPTSYPKKYAALPGIVPKRATCTPGKNPRHKPSVWYVLDKVSRHASRGFGSCAGSLLLSCLLRIGVTMDLDLRVSRG
mmetsp:Transcript_1792/g.6055  ORF Transcript_1792/g.6055 Transcript_1792/m.6055 type:complete len:187 (+) Transcript_1792:1545-2105(+)